MSNKNTKTRNKTDEAVKKTPKAPVNDCYQPTDTLDTSNPPVDISDDSPVVDNEATKEKTPEAPATEATKEKSPDAPVADAEATKPKASKTPVKETEQPSADELKALEIMEANNVKKVFRVGSYWFTKHEYASQHSKETDLKIETFTK
jgi:uncharacterized membrane protein